MAFSGLVGQLPPHSCDTFAVLPPGAGNCVVFGKNSDRPNGEVQEVAYFDAADHPPGSKLKCTYIEIDQAQHTHAVILSKPSWMWGAEMGANEHGLCIGNEAVWTKVGGSPDSTERLLGMDLLRLGLERASSAREALDVLTNLLEEHGQGGNCSDTIPNFTYHNSFLIADPEEVWILETAKKLWAAEKITKGVRNISNDLSIGTTITLMSAGLERYAEDRGLWHPDDGPLNFKKVIGYGEDDDDDEDYRYRCGKQLLTILSSSGTFGERDMFRVLRDKPSGICMSSGSFVTTGSQVSVLRPKESGKPCCHWFTATPDPSRSVFKPFVFVDGVASSGHVVSSPLPQAHPAGVARFDRRHELYKLHEALLHSGTKCSAIHDKRQQLEDDLLKKAKKICDSKAALNTEGKTLFKSAVEEEIRLLQSCSEFCGC